MTDEDRELLDWYLAVGAEPWNKSTEAAWYELELRVWVESRLPAHRPLRACNVGIGVGLWDDWLALAIGAPLTSVDRDAASCRMLGIRQRRERHPYPSELVCGDVLDGALAGRAFDVITAVGSTLRENADRADEVLAALVAALAPGGVVLVAEAMPAETAVPAASEIRTFGGVQLATRVVHRPS